VNGDLQSFKLLVGEYGADVHARARGRFFMPEDCKVCKDKIKQETNYDGEWSKVAHSLLLDLLLCCFLGFVDWSSKNLCLGSSSVFVFPLSRVSDKTRCAVSCEKIGISSCQCHSLIERLIERFSIEC